MKPDSQINEYKRMYRHNQDDSRADYELFAELKQSKPDFQVIQKLTERLYYFEFCVFYKYSINYI